MVSKLFWYYPELTLNEAIRGTRKTGQVFRSSYHFTNTICRVCTKAPARIRTK